mgnify:CR=1 FL=1
MANKLKEVRKALKKQEYYYWESVESMLNESKEPKKYNGFLK